jgi:Protein of unknown function (DUF1569)
MDSHLQRLKESIASATRGMRADDLTRPAEGKWSVAEILEHLYLTYAGTTKAFQRCLEAGKPLATSATLKQRIVILYVVGMSQFPGGRQAPKYTMPRGVPLEKIVTDVAAQIVTMENNITECEKRFGKRTKLLDHPILGPLTAHQWRKFHWVHGQHHVKQILRMRGNS